MSEETGIEKAVRFGQSLGASALDDAEGWTWAADRVASWIRELNEIEAELRKGAL